MRPSDQVALEELADKGGVGDRRGDVVEGGSIVKGDRIGRVL